MATAYADILAAVPGGLPGHLIYGEAVAALSGTMNLGPMTQPNSWLAIRGTPSYPTAARCAVVGDINGDGLDDIAFLDAADYVYVLPGGANDARLGLRLRRSGRSAWRSISLVSCGLVT